MLNELKTLHEKGSYSCECILIIDEMYLRKSAQYQSGEYVEIDEEGIITFMVVGLKQSIPFVVQAILEVIFNGHWLVEKTSDNIDKLIEFGLCVPSIQITDNHSANVNAFSALIKITLQCLVVTKGHVDLLKQTCSF